MMKKWIILGLLSLFTINIYAQSADVITDILESDQVTMGQICYLSAVNQGLISDEATYSAAINVLYENGQLPSKVYEASPAPLVNVAFIFAQIWDIKGGLLYRAFHGAPRYAYKQLKADGVLPDFADPGLVMTGAEALNFYTSCVIKYGNMQLTVE